MAAGIVWKAFSSGSIVPKDCPKQRSPRISNIKWSICSVRLVGADQSSAVTNNSFQRSTFLMMKKPAERTDLSVKAVLKVFLFLA